VISPKWRSVGQPEPGGIALHARIGVLPRTRRAASEECARRAEWRRLGPRRLRRLRCWFRGRLHAGDASPSNPRRLLCARSRRNSCMRRALTAVRSSLLLPARQWMIERITMLVAHHATLWSLEVCMSPVKPAALVGNDQTRRYRGEIDPLEAFKITVCVECFCPGGANVDHGWLQSSQSGNHTPPRQISCGGRRPGRPAVAVRRPSPRLSPCGRAQTATGP
jgi:hypothetical protein